MIKVIIEPKETQILINLIEGKVQRLKDAFKDEKPDYPSVMWYLESLQSLLQKLTTAQEQVKTNENRNSKKNPE